MAFDIYAGPISRYLAGDWKTIGQVAAEAAGYEYVVHGRKKPGLLAKLAQKRKYDAWLGRIDTFRADIGEPGLRWDDDASRPYWSDRPGWEGYFALQVVPACHLQPGLTLPSDPVDHEAFDSEAFFDAVDDDQSPINSLMSTHIWIPGSFADRILIKHFDDQEVVLGSLRALDSALDAAADALGVSRQELEKANRDQPGPETGWGEAARYGLAVFGQGVRFAIEHRVPLLLDY